MDEEEEGTRRKEQRVGRSDKEERATKRRKTRPSEANDASFSDFFISHFFNYLNRKKITTGEYLCVLNCAMFN